MRYAKDGVREEGESGEREGREGESCIGFARMVWGKALSCWLVL